MDFFDGLSSGPKLSAALYDAVQCFGSVPFDPQEVIATVVFTTG